MVVVPKGEFWMGSPEGEEGRDGDERRHPVEVGGFAMGRYEVTVEAFQRFVEETGYRTDAERNAGGREGCWSYEKDAEKPWDWRGWASWRKPNQYQANQGLRPVSCVSWNDAVAYAKWLSEETGEGCRLPTEAV
jgi:serine/threonine-protein kinase PpkA